MKSKTPYILTLIGVILGFITSFITILQYFFFKSFGQDFVNSFFNGIEFNINIILNFILISSILGLLFSVILTFYVVRLSKNPTKKDFIVTIVLGSLGALIGMGIGGILVLIGGIIGIVKLEEK